jgi:hypothetical protein
MLENYFNPLKKFRNFKILFNADFMQTFDILLAASTLA